MKNLCLLDYAGNVRPGKPTIEAIERVLEGQATDQLATIQLDDGVVVATLLSDSERAALRGDMSKRRVEALVAALDASLALHRATDGIPGVSAPYGSISIDCGDAPWAEQPVIDWAHARGMHVDNEAPPIKSGTWTRRVEVRLGERSWTPTIATIRYPEVYWDHAESVARDAETDNKADAAKASRTEDVNAQF